MSEQDPSLTLNLSDGQEFKMTPANATLYTFMGRTAIGDLLIENESINHVFVQTGKNEREQATGMYLFHEFDEVYGKIAAHMVEHRYPMILNQRHLPECDLKAWLARVDNTTAEFGSQIPDSMPEN